MFWSCLPTSLFFLAAATFNTTKQSLSISQSTVRSSIRSSLMPEVFAHYSSWFQSKNAIQLHCNYASGYYLLSLHCYRGAWRCRRTHTIQLITSCSRQSPDKGSGEIHMINSFPTTVSAFANPSASFYLPWPSCRESGRTFPRLCSEGPTWKQIYHRSTKS